MTFKSYRRRALTAFTAFGLVGALGACDNLLEVQNPGAVNESDLNDPLVQQQVVNTAIGDFQRMYDDLVFASALLSDEADNGHNFTQWIDTNLRVIEPSNSTLSSDVYAPLQRARAGADNLTERLRTVLGDQAGTNLGLARVIAYAGYGNLLLGELYCESPIQDDQPAISSDELFNRAIARFDEVIQIANAAKAANAAKTDSANTLINLARVGAARAALQRGEMGKAAQYASQVPASFEFTVNYSDNRSYQENRFFYAANGSGRYIGVSSKFRNLNDPRVRHNATAQSGHSPDAVLYAPFQGWSHTGYSKDAGVTFAKATGFKLASGVEAQYIVAEAEGLNATNLAFINSRRAEGNQTPLLIGALNPASFQVEVRDQRRRDLFLSLHRLGDIRRYKKLYSISEYRTGAHPVSKWGNFDLAECFVPSLNERIGNPAY